jgi:methyl-coenzyme M reductase beta subunit
MIDLTKSTVAVNLAGLEASLSRRSRSAARNHSSDAAGLLDRQGRRRNLRKIKSMVQVTEGDDTKITSVGGGKLLLIEVPSARLRSCTYDAASPRLHPQPPRGHRPVQRRHVRRFVRQGRLSGVSTRRPWTCRARTSSRSCPSPRTTRVSGTRSGTSAQPAVMMTTGTRCRAPHSPRTFEQAGEFEMGMAIGPFERASSSATHTRA